MTSKLASHFLLTLSLCAISFTNLSAAVTSIEPIDMGAFWIGAVATTGGNQIGPDTTSRFQQPGAWEFGWARNSWTLPGVSGAGDFTIANYSNGYLVFDTSSLGGDVSSATLQLRISREALSSSFLRTTTNPETSRIDLFDVTTNIPAPSTQEEFEAFRAQGGSSWYEDYLESNTSRHEPFFNDLESGESYGSVVLGRFDEYVDEPVSIELSNAAIAALNATDTFVIGANSPRYASQDPFISLESGVINATDIRLELTTEATEPKSIPEPSTLAIFGFLAGLACVVRVVSNRRERSRC